MLVDGKTQYELALCTCIPEDQLYPELHQKRGGQQGKRGDCPCLLCPFEAPLGALCPGLGSPTQEIRQVFGDGPEEGVKNGQRTGIPLL